MKKRVELYRDEFPVLEEYGWGYSNKIEYPLSSISEGIIFRTELALEYEMLLQMGAWELAYNTKDYIVTYLN